MTADQTGAERPSSEEYQVKISGGAFSFDGKVPGDVARRLMVVLMSGTDTSASTTRQNYDLDEPGPQSPHEGTNGDRPSVTIGEFVRDAEPKRNPDKITAIGVYLREHRDQDVFSPADIVAGFEEAGEPAPGNISRDLKWTVVNKWIAPKSGVRGGYFVTNSGIEAVTQKFPKQLIKRTQVPESRRRSGGRRRDTND